MDKETSSNRLPKPRRIFGVVGFALTAIYGAALLGLLASRWGGFWAMPLNEMGDFAAGAFSPLAFLWLVVGYLQQGDELKQNTAALEMQADELKASVAEQRELVRVTREAFEREKAAQELALSASLRLTTKTINVVVGMSELELELTNGGHVAFNIKAVFTSVNPRHLLTYSVNTLDDEKPFRFRVSETVGRSESATLVVSFTDGTNRKREAVWTLKRLDKYLAAESPIGMISETST